MREILNQENKQYAEACLKQVLDIGLNFKLNNNFKAKKYMGQNFDKLLDIPYDGVELKKLLKNFENEILPYCSNFANENLWDFQMLVIQ